MQPLKAAIRRVTGRRAHLLRGYHVLIHPTDQTFPVGGSVVEASVLSLRHGCHFRAKIFEDRLFILDEMIIGGQYLPELARFRMKLKTRARDGRIYVVDGGANSGLFTLFASLILHPSIHSDGFEPFVENRALCEDNWRGRGHRIHPLSLADRDDDEVPLYLRSTTGATIMSGEPREENTASVRVRTVRLDTLFKELDIPRVDLVKLDIEGAEELALAGATETIARDRPFILCSYEHRGNSRDRILDIVTECGEYIVHDDQARRLLTFEPPTAR